jgi:molecular chaperone DnaJ
MNRDPYEVLGIPQSATDDEIKAAYRALAKRYHPDLNGGSAAAEAKMKEVNEAYTLLIKNKGQNRQQGGYGQSGYGSNGQGGGYGAGGPFGGYGGNGQRSSQNSGGFGDFDPFGFGDFFRQAQQQQARGGQTTYTEYDPLLKTVEDSVLDGDFARAAQMLQTIRDRRAAWYYWSARVNIGLGNRVQALSDARAAAQMAPDEAAYRELLATLQSSGQSYQQYGSQRGFLGAMCANPCITLMAANVLCNCCLGGRCNMCYC